MCLCSDTRLRAFVFSGSLLLAGLLCLLFLPAAPAATAFDEDHHEIINGVMLHFRVRGTDKSHPYLLILHGGPGFSAYMFYPWGTSLEKTLNVVYLDQRGSGESARLTVANIMAPTAAEIQGYTVANLLRDIEGVRQSLKVDKWYVLGHSWGGMLGLEYVTAHPAHVLGYIHMDGLVSVPQMQNAILDNAERKFSAATPKDAANRAAVTQLRALPPDNPVRLFGAFGLAMGPAGLYFAGDQQAGFAAFRDRLRQAVQNYHIADAALQRADEPGTALIVNDHFLTRDDTPLLAKVSVPTLILNGRQDGVIPPSAAEAAHAAVKGSQLVELDHCGHFPFFEQPQKTTAAVLAFTLSVSHTKTIVATWSVDKNGHPKDIRFPTSGDCDADRAIREAIEGLHYKPALRDGKPQTATLTHTFVIKPN